MASALKAKPAGEELQLFCNDTREYVYLGSLQNWLTFRYPNNPFPGLQALAQQGRVFTRLPKKLKRGDINYDKTKFACDYLRLHCFSGKFIRKATCHATEKGIQYMYKEQQGCRVGAEAYQGSRKGKDESR
jgi:hypothetical protein